jgi:hypothetical protein
VRVGKKAYRRLAPRSWNHQAVTMACRRESSGRHNATVP